MCKALWTLLRGSLVHTLILSVFPSDLPGVNPATLNGILLYYRLMTKWSGLGDSTELSRVGLSHLPKPIGQQRPCLHGRASPPPVPWRARHALASAPL
jgi:hypothetical protein